MSVLQAGLQGSTRKTAPKTRWKNPRGGKTQPQPLAVPQAGKARLAHTCECTAHTREISPALARGALSASIAVGDKRSHPGLYAQG